MSFTPRAYQTAAVDAVIKGYSEGKRKLLLRLPTGAGKTVIAALLIERMLARIEGRRILFLAHRREIVDQTAEKIAEQIGAHGIGIEQAERRILSGAETRVVVASIQSLSSRLADFDAAAYGALIVDECHHAYAKTWMEAIAHFGKREDTLILGLTATPKRSDGRCVGELFQETAFEISLAELQEQGYLVPMDYYTIEASLGLGRLARDAQGDFQAAALGRVMNIDDVRALTIKAWSERARSQKTIVFCASVEHANSLAQDFMAMGVRAQCVSAQTPGRQAIVSDFRRGDLQVLTNFGVFTEGFDDPTIGCVLLARPTTSPLIFNQCLGRGLRSHPGKRLCTVIDIVDRQQHELQYNAFEAAGLKRGWRGSGRDPLREAAAIAKIKVTDPGAFLRIRSALSLTETHDILMSLDPRIVLAGIDGMPLLRYAPLAARRSLDADEVRPLVSALLAKAGVELQDLGVQGDTLSLVVGRASILPPLSPYLSWHIAQATGFPDVLMQEMKMPRPEAEPPGNMLPESQPRMADAKEASRDAEETLHVKDRSAHPTQKKGDPGQRPLGLMERLDLLKGATPQAPARPVASASTAPPPPPNPPSPARGLSIQQRLQAIKADCAKIDS